MSKADRITIQATVGGTPVELVTRPGFPGWDALTQAEALLAAYAEIAPGQRVLVYPGGHGALAVWLAKESEAGAILAADTNCVAVGCAEATAARNGVAERVRLSLGLPGQAGSELDVILLRVPKGRDLARLLFLEAFAALRPGGHLYLAGANREGIKSVAADCAALFGEGTLLGYKGGNRVLLYTRPEALPEPLPAEYTLPGVARGTWHEFAVSAGEATLTVRTRPGVFSWRGLDAGTGALLEVLAGEGMVRATDEVLDVGCGAGLIGLYAATRARQGRVTMVDVDWLATESARASVAQNGLTNCEVRLGDGVPAGERAYTLIVSNPPFHSGHATSLDAAEGFIREARGALRPGGRLLVVANRFLPYDRLMAAEFGQAEVLVSTPRYWVLAARR